MARTSSKTPQPPPVFDFYEGCYFMLLMLLFSRGWIAWFLIALLSPVMAIMSGYLDDDD